MKIPTSQTDNVIEILSMVLDFTDRRGKLLNDNIVNINTPGFRPADLDAVCFADLMSRALSEYLINSRLVLVDTENIRFGPNGSFTVEPVIDTEASRILTEDKKAYVKYQMRKISENQKNKRAAIQLLEQKQARIPNSICTKNKK